MPPFPGDPNYRQLLAVHSTRNGVPLEDRIRDGTGQPPVDEVDEVAPPQTDVPRETPVEEPEAEPPPAAARRRR